MSRLLCSLALLAPASLAAGGPSLVEPLRDGIWLVRDDNGSWGGMVNGITHQVAPTYQVRKTLDLSDLSAADWARVREARLSLYFMVRDYSWHDLPAPNGLDEAYEIRVNGTVHRFATNGGAPVFAEGAAPTIAWHDIDVPVAELRRGPNEIVVAKAGGDKHDDYLYLGIDNSAHRGNSAVTFDGQAWRQDALTVPGGNGEYLIRLYLFADDRAVTARWQPGREPALEDPAGLIAYAGRHRATVGPDGLALAPGQSARLEWQPEALDPWAELTARLELDGTAQVAWLDDADAPQEAASLTGAGERNLPAGRAIRPSGLLIVAGEQPVTIRAVEIRGRAGYHPVPAPIDLAPVMKPLPPMTPPVPSARVDAKRAELIGGGLVASFAVADGQLRLTSLQNDVTGGEMLRGEPPALFLIEVDGKRYAGARDFACAPLEPVPGGFRARLNLAEPALGAELTATVDDDGVHLALELLPAAALEFKLAFPHLAGLAVGDDPASDYYYFPLGRGIIADRPALLRKGYGDHEALYQLFDLFSPSAGGGLALRIDDAAGWHKVMALRKHVPGAGEFVDERLSMQVRPEYVWTNPLEAIPGTSLAVEYLRRARAPGGGYAPAPAVLFAHRGDWRVAMRAYADWAHRVWRFQPGPNPLRTIHTMIAAGWGQDILFRDGAYRTNLVRPGCDCIELMSWWDWAPHGPFGTPFERLGEVLTPAQIRDWEPYFVTDPVTGQRMWNNQPGDYRGYNERFGGLPAFRASIDEHRRQGAMVTLYTDPFRLDGSCETGREHGEAWGVVGVDGKKTRAYEVWNPCHDLPDVRAWVAETMARVMRETGADGLRLDEYGHRGWACYDPSHQHTFAEPGITQWMKATAETTRLVREALDRVNPDLVLTTEHPGYDYLMQYLDGCITYDLTVQRSPLRPLEVNTQRFFFPECKAYELDHQTVDPKDRRKFWNAVESFGRFWPPTYDAILREHEDAYQSGDAEPLVATPGRTQGILVNRFIGGGKTLWHVFNATGHTHDGAALSIAVAPDEHLVDLLACEEAQYTPRADGLGHDVTLYLPRGEVACLAQLPRVLTARRQGETLLVTSTEPGVLRLSGGDGEVLGDQPAVRGVNRVAPIPVGARMIKLLRGRDVVDALPLP